MSKMRRILAGGDKGFTLIELLVVIAVLGILAAIAIPRISGVTNEAQLAELKATGSSVRSAIEMHIAAENAFPGSAGDTEFTFADDYNIGINLDAYTIAIADGGDGMITDYSVTLTPDYATGGNPNVVVTPAGITVTDSEGNTI
jgi:general secretion pathway protein G